MGSILLELLRHGTALAERLTPQSMFRGEFLLFNGLKPGTMSLRPAKQTAPQPVIAVARQIRWITNFQIAADHQQTKPIMRRLVSFVGVRPARRFTIEPTSDFAASTETPYLIRTNSTRLIPASCDLNSQKHALSRSQAMGQKFKSSRRHHPDKKSVNGRTVGNTLTARQQGATPIFSTLTWAIPVRTKSGSGLQYCDSFSWCCNMMAIKT